MNTIRMTVLSLVFFSAAPAFAQHQSDVWVARTAAGQLTIAGFQVGQNAIQLPPTSGLFNGWSDNDPGFDRVIADDPPSDVFQLQAGAQISLVVVDFDPALRAIDTSFNILDDPGESTFLGTQNLHTHLTWNINSDDPAFDIGQYLWNATVRLEDNGTTNYTASDPFTLHFVNIDCDSGDVDGNGTQELADVSTFVSLLLDPGSASNEETCAADLTFDGEIDGADIQVFVDRLLGN